MTAPSAYILVVDDEPDLRTLYELTLLREGYRVETAGDLAEARQYLQEKRFDAVITDMRLPDAEALLLQEFPEPGRLADIHRLAARLRQRRADGDPRKIGVDDIRESRIQRMQILQRRIAVVWIDPLDERTVGKGFQGPAGAGDPPAGVGDHHVGQCPHRGF